MMASRIFPIFLIALVFVASAAWSQTPTPDEKSCAQASAKSSGNATTGNSADNPPQLQGVEHSAILPDAGGHEDSAAPTVKKDGEDVTEDTNCPKPPNRLAVPSGASKK
jgi:hypothetical protein